MSLGTTYVTLNNKDYYNNNIHLTIIRTTSSVVSKRNAHQQMEMVLDMSIIVLREKQDFQFISEDMYRKRKY